MRTKRLMLVVLLGLCGSAIFAEQRVGVPGSGVEFATPIESSIGGRTVKLNLTGAGLRTKVFFKVYAIGSYLEDGVTVRSGAELYRKDCAKQLYLVMERGVSGKDFTDALRAAIRANHAEPKFEKELQLLSEAVQKYAIEKGDHVWLTHVPGVGLHCNLVGKTEILIKNVAFAQALWEAYVGKNCIAEELRKGLLSRLKP
jgi:hypothetical protein